MIVSAFSVIARDNGLVLANLYAFCKLFVYPPGVYGASKGFCQGILLFRLGHLGIYCLGNGFMCFKCQSVFFSL